MNLKQRRNINIICFAVIAFFMILIHKKIQVSLLDVSIYSGWTLFVLMVFMATYNIRKKFTFLPLGSSSFWLQLHIYGGLYCSLVFLFHIDFRWPTGHLEATMSILFALIFLSGILGLVISRIFPRRLSAKDEEFIYERIPQFRKTVRTKAEELILKSIPETGSNLIAEFYKDEIAGFMAQPKFLIYHFWGSQRPLVNILRKLDSLSRYVSEKEQGHCKQLRELITKKYDLDYSLCLQGCLKYWLFIHIPLTYSLMLFVILHIILVYAFTGGHT
jgi:hypothetical protein